MKILWAVINQDEAILALRSCAKHGHETTIVLNAKDLRSEIGNNHDLVVIDQNLPDEVGITLVRELRAAGVKLPLVIYANLRFELNGGLAEEGAHAGATAVYSKETDPTCEVLARDLALFA